MRIAVTGGAGRLGRSVVTGLREAGHDVVSIDRTAETDQDIATDLTDAEQVAEVFHSLRPEAVAHLAAIAVPFSAPERQIFNVNTGMGFNVLETAVNTGAHSVLVASSPTVLGYGRDGWNPGRLPLNEQISPEPSHAYALSKVVLEQMVASFARGHSGTRLASFRPCYVVAPEEWQGAVTQQGHTIEERLAQPELAAVSLFNYLDARDAADFVEAWLTADGSPSGACYFVSADDALTVRPPAELLADYLPDIAHLADQAAGYDSLFSAEAAAADCGWRPKRSWRSELHLDAQKRLGV